MIILIDDQYHACCLAYIDSKAAVQKDGGFAVSGGDILSCPGFRADVGIGPYGCVCDIVDNKIRIVSEIA